MTPALRLLMVAPYPLFPLVAGGKIRIYQLARHLVELGVEVSVLCPYKPGGAGQPKGWPARMIHVPYPFLFHHLLTDRPLPYQFLISFHPGYAALVRRHLQGADVIQFEHASFSDLLPVVPRAAAIVYDAHNVEFEYVTSEGRSDLVRNLVGRRIFALEGSMVRRADHILTCAAEDSARMSSLYGVDDGRFSVIPNGVEVGAAAADSAAQALARLPALAGFRYRALFSGSDVEHNRQAVRFLINELAPRLAPDGAIVIHGGCGKRLRQPLPANVFVETSGANIQRIAAACTVAVHPVVQGSGTSLKLLDYLAHGLAVISTEFGVRGYPDLRALVQIRPLAQFARAVASPAAPPVGASAALAPYLWRTGAARALEIYQRLVERHRRLRGTGSP